MKRTTRLFSFLAVIFLLCVSLLAGCGSNTPDTDAATTADTATTTTAGDATTTDSAVSTDSTASGKKTSTTKKPTQGTSATNGGNAQAPIASVSGIQIGGTALSGFSSSKMTYVHYLPTGTKTVPKVTATKSGGTGEISITQATNVYGTAKVSLNDVTYTIQFVVKRAEGEILNNTYYQLKTANKLNVAYLGGSVTAGYNAEISGTEPDCWRTLTTNWFKSQYPSATITETNAGIGGTGSMYGAYRVIQDLKLETQKPDLVFIEFASNDEGDNYVNKTPDVYMESIIRTIYQYAPQADIVMVFITGYNTKDTEFASKAAHKQIADIYQIPYIDVGARLWKEMVAENGGNAPNQSSAVWKKYFSDSVHPAKAGYAKYAQYVKEYLEGVLFAKSAVPASRVNAPMPSASVTTLPVSPYIDNLKGLSLPSNFIVAGDGTVVAKQGGTFTIKFTGTQLYAWIYGHGSTEDQAGFIRVSVDGGKRQKILLTGNNHKILPIATGLSNGEHTVTIQVSSTSVGKVDFDLRYFLISGDTQKRGITLG